MEVEFCGGLKEEVDSLNKLSDKPPPAPKTDRPTATSTLERHGAPFVQNGGDKSVSQSEADDAPLILKGETEGPSCENEAASDTLEEMESKYAAYVRNDTYGPMGKGDIPISEKALLVLGLLIMVPIKVVLILAILITYYLICRICTLFRSPYQYQGEEKEVDNSAYPLRKENEENNSHTKEFQMWDKSQENYAHMTGLRRSIIVHSGRFLSRAVLFVLGFYCIKVTHRERTGVIENSKDETLQDRILQSGAIISNHVSYLDILYHMSASFPSFVAKRSVGKLPLVGLISKCLGCVYVQREDKASGFKGVSGTVSERLQAVSRDKDAPLMMLFPEGTTTNGNYLLPFKTGAFLSQTPVQPVILRYPYTRFSPAWDSISGVRHVVFLFCQFINHLEVVWLPIYFPSEKEKLDPKLYASNVRKWMADEGSLTLADIGLPEKRIYHTFLNDLLADEPSA